MSRIILPWLRTGRWPRRLAVILALALLCLSIATVFAGAAFAEGETLTTTAGGEIATSEGLEAPELDYSFVWWTFILTFGLLALYYVVILRISNTEFKKIVDAHFGPKQDGR
jgi:glucan phosphoethanolaminetransferase (alkaline phosphatase superfamily)